MKFIIETNRLGLRELVLDDKEFVITLLNSPGWLRFIGDRNVRTMDEARAYLENGPITSYRVNGYGLSLVQLKANGTAIGMCGMIKRDTLDHPDIGFAFLPEYMGQGYAVEIAMATMYHAKHTLGIQNILAIVDPDNDRSIRILEKIGLSYMRHTYLEDGTDLLLFGNYPS